MTRPFNSTPMMRPMPRTSRTPGASSATRRSRKYAPLSRAFSTSPSSASTRSVARAAAQITGLPPKVLPWDMAGTSRTESAQSAAPTGRPPAMALARQRMSGRRSWCWQANRAPVLPKPVCTSSTTNRAPRSRHRASTRLRYAPSASRTPPSPCTTSRITAAVPSSMDSSMAAASLYLTWVKPGTSGSKGARYLGFQVALRAPKVRP